MHAADVDHLVFGIHNKTGYLKCRKDPKIGA